MPRARRRDRARNRNQSRRATPDPIGKTPQDGGQSAAGPALFLWQLPRRLLYSLGQRGGSGRKQMSTKGIKTLSFVLLVALTLYLAFGGGS